ncbi:unnamed protein product [Phytomonas sp. Hart1]|nr:unnamed protein product [Phytomonas sp. Hart1]|eukprot:CCW69868.1 unnamed protein product [Phytomonas sp. isolate Hart1]
MTTPVRRHLTSFLRETPTTQTPTHTPSRMQSIRERIVRASPLEGTGGLERNGGLKSVPPIVKFYSKEKSRVNGVPVARRSPGEVFMEELWYQENDNF